MPPRPPVHSQHRLANVNRHEILAEQQRPSATSRGYNARWNRARLHFLRDNPLCVTCHVRGVIVAATVVDHIQRHRGDSVLFWDQDNWQPLCKPCHDRKTGTEQASFTKPRDRY